MYAMLNALAAGSVYLRDIAYGGTGNDTVLADDGDDAEQVTSAAGPDDCVGEAGPRRWHAGRGDDASAHPAPTRHLPTRISP